MKEAGVVVWPANFNERYASLKRELPDDYAKRHAKLSCLRDAFRTSHGLRRWT
jgi:signal recognition particle subunit SEC65